MIPPIARQFVAGETTAEVLEHVRDLNERNVGGMVNLLGSHNDDRSTANAHAAIYRTLVDEIAAADLDAAVSVKPTQIGLDVNEAAFRELLGGVVESARARDVFVWLDMEEPWTVDPTLDAFEEFGRTYVDGMGVCVQANLKRTPDDLDRLADVPGKVRLVKGGAYDVPPSIGHRDGDRIDEAYRELLGDAFERFDDGIAVATHDPEMIDYATSLHEQFDTGFEIQMVMGVRTRAQFRLADEYDVRQYVPFGKRWKRWVVNRARNDVRFASRAVVGRYVGDVL